MCVCVLGHKTPWKWTSAHDKAFQKSKKLLTSSQLLVHFDPELPITVACDASAYGLGVVLAHKMPDGSEVYDLVHTSLLEKPQDFRH